MDAVNTIKFKIDELTTRSVTLFPTRAQVYRDLKDLQLKPGVNEITIAGLTPTLDIDSVKVEGSGSAVITDISVDLRPNKEIFNVVYPEDSDSGDDDDDLDDAEIKDNAALLSAKSIADQLNDKYNTFKEQDASASKRLQILDSYSASLDGKSNSDIAKFMEHYKEARGIAFQDSEAAKQGMRNMRAALAQADEAVAKLQRVANKARQKHMAAIAKEKQKQQSARREKAAEKERIRKERLKFWPNMCHCVTITLDVNTATPISSRRNSISSEIDLVKVAQDSAVDDDDAITSCDLVLSYMTSSAWWTPSYDLQLSTTASNATMCFDALLRNQTSESWKNCKVSLSTSETASSGLDDAIPTLLPWHIRLSKKHEAGYGAGITRSSNEVSNRANYANNLGVKKSANTDRAYFGAPTGAGPNQQLMQPEVQTLLLQQQQMKRQQMQAQTDFRSFNGTERERRASGDGIHSVPGAAAFSMAMPAAFGNAAPVARAAMAPVAWPTSEHDEKTDLPGPPTEESVDFEESLMEATGLTTTYDLPGTKTLLPKSVASKQRVARMNFSNVSFSHTVVAKYKPVAYLKAKLKNNSKLNLMQGAVGLTLDGSFIGRSKIPRCSSGDVFSLSLGIDPAIKVSYPKPEVRRATAGIFNKEDSSVYARAIILYNTRATTEKAASMLILDQIPVSEDDKLRVDVVTPTGLVQEGKAVATGAPLREMNRDKDWGKASAKLKERGIIHWNVDLNAGKAVKLWLEYCVSLPTGDSAIEC